MSKILIGLAAATLLAAVAVVPATAQTKQDTGLRNGVSIDMSARYYHRYHRYHRYYGYRGYHRYGYRRYVGGSPYYAYAPGPHYGWGYYAPRPYVGLRVW